MRNEVILKRVGGRQRILKRIKRKKKINWLGHLPRTYCILKDSIEGRGGKRKGKKTNSDECRGLNLP